MEINTPSKESYKADFIESERSILFKMAYVLIGTFVGGILLFITSSDELIHGIGLSFVSYSIIIFLSDWRSNFRFFQKRKTDSSLEHTIKQLEKLVSNSNLVVQLDLAVFFMGLFSTFFTGLIWRNPFVLGASLSLTFLGAIKLSFDLFNNWKRSESLRKLKSE